MSAYCQGYLVGIFGIFYVRY